MAVGVVAIGRVFVSVNEPRMRVGVTVFADDRSRVDMAVMKVVMPM